MSVTDGAHSSLTDHFPEVERAWVDDAFLDAESLLNELSWVDYDSTVDVNDPEVHHISAGVRLSDALERTVGLTADSPSIGIQGTVSIREGRAPLLALVSDSGFACQIGGIGEIAATLKLSTAGLGGRDEGDAEIVELFVEIAFDIPLSSERSVRVSTRLGHDRSKLRLVGLIDGDPVSGFAALEGLLGPSMGEVEDQLGKPLSALADLSVKSVEIGLDQSNPDLIDLVSLTLESVTQWEVGNRAVSAPPAERLAVNLAVFDPFGEARSVRAVVTADVADWVVVEEHLELTDVEAWLAVDAVRSAGKWSVSSYGGIEGSLVLPDDGRLTVHLPVPPTDDDWTFDLNTSAPILTQAAVEKFLHVDPLPGPLAAALESVRVPHVGLRVTPSPLKLHDVSAKLELEDPLSLIDDKLVIKSVDVDLYVDDPVGEAHVTGSVTGYLTIGSGSVQLHVGRYEAADEWAVAVGATDIDLGTISDVVTALQAAAGGPDWGAHIPSVLARRHFTLKDLSIDYVLEPTRFHGMGFELVSPKSEGGEILDMVDASLRIDVDHSGDADTTKIRGNVDIAGQDFGLDFERKGDDALIVGFYVNEAGSEVSLSDIIADVAPGAVGPGVNLDVHIEDALFAHGDGWELVGADLDGRLDLSDLPMVGKALPVHGSISLDLRATAASDDVSVGDLRRVNGLLPATIRPLPDDVQNEATKVGLEKGVALLAALRIGEAHIDLALPVSLSDSGEVEHRPGAASKPPAASHAVDVPTDSIHWIKIQRHFGPIHFQRIGAALAGSDLTLAIDASVEVSGLTLSLEGLSVSTPLGAIHPTFGLRGIGIDYSNGDIEIGGALLMLGPDDFAGAATITTPQLTLSALGAYTKAHGHPSMFVSAVLDSPIGGPAFFYVTGLSAAFGYNRALQMPPPEGVRDFPLVEQARRGAGADIDLAVELAALAGAIPVDIGQNFLAVGVKFTSFKQIDSFALLAVQFGHQTEIDLLGVSHLVVPAPTPGVVTPPVADIEIGLRGRFVPDEGFLGIDARLTPNSYILSTACRLTGGFAFYSWFSGDSEGDFVLSVGGYHPSFVPTNSAYPTVPRVAFNWTIAPHVTIKGSGYFALTPDLMMAGGHLEATYQNGPVRAWFQLTIDVLLAWQPFHYEASMSVHVGGSYTFTFFGTHTISVDVGAAVSVRGPDFSGHAEIDLTVAKIGVDFGRAISPATTITWQQFEDSFLPVDEHTVGVTIEQGLVNGSEQPHHLGVVNPAELRIATHSAIPCTSISVNDAPLDDLTYTALGVGSCGVAVGTLNSTHEITVNLIEGQTKTPIDRPTDWFVFAAITKNVPAALWGKPTAGRPNLGNGVSPLIENAVVGLSIEARRPQADGRNPHPTAKARQTVIDVQVSPRPTIGAAPFAKLTNAAIGRVTDAGALRSKALQDMGLDPSFVRVGRLADVGRRLEGGW